MLPGKVHRSRLPRAPQRGWRLKKHCTSEQVVAERREVHVLIDQVASDGAVRALVAKNVRRHPPRRPRAPNRQPSD